VSGQVIDEGRGAPRQRVLKAGTISFGGAGISCTIRNFSETGAALEVTSPIGIPEEFVLVIEADNSTRQCRVVWRTERRIGVTFQR
jgi:PilZ domain